MGRDAPAVQEARRGEHHGAAAHGPEPTALRRISAQPVEQDRIGGCVAEMRRAGDQQRIEDGGLAGTEDHVREDAKAGRADDGSRGGRDDTRDVGLAAGLDIRLGEDIQRTGHVQHLDAVEREDADRSGTGCCASHDRVKCPYSS